MNAGNDTAWGNAADNRIELADGDDSGFGYGGNDTLDGGSGVDTLQGGVGDGLIYVVVLGNVIVSQLHEDDFTFV